MVSDNMIICVKKLINKRISEITKVLNSLDPNERKKFKAERRELQRQINLLHEGRISCHEKFNPPKESE